MVQINGSLNHKNINQRYRDVVQLNRFSTLYKGFSYNMLSSSIYYIMILALEKNRTKKRGQEGN